jgi:hypothetical protein
LGLISGDEKARGKPKNTGIVKGTLRIRNINLKSNDCYWEKDLEKRLLNSLSFSTSSIPLAVITAELAINGGQGKDLESSTYPHFSR